MKSSTVLGLGLGAAALAAAAAIAMGGKTSAPAQQTTPGGGTVTLTQGHRYQMTSVCPTTPVASSTAGFTLVSGPTAGPGNSFVSVFDYSLPTATYPLAALLPACTNTVQDLGLTPSAGPCVLPENPTPPISALCIVTNTDQVQQVQQAVAAALASGAAGIPGAPAYLPTDVDGNAANPKWVALVKVAQAYFNSSGAVAKAGADVTPGALTNWPTALRTDGVLDVATAATAGVAA